MPSLTVLIVVLLPLEVSCRICYGKRCSASHLPAPALSWDRRALEDFRGPIRGAAWNRGYFRIVDAAAIAQIGITGDIHTNE
jgi:hypothetical protein